MSERLSSSYQPLFQVHILHHYWLDDGNVLFDTLPEDAAELAELKLPGLTSTREHHLRNYDVRKFLTINPVPTTAKSLLRLGCIFKNTALGFVVITPKSSVLPQDLQFEFVLTVKNPDFFNYTAHTIRPQPISELYQPAENKTCRYKNNVAVLSNLSGDSRTVDSNKSLYLSKPFPEFSDSDDYPVEALVQIGDALVQFTSDRLDTGQDQQQINAQAAAMPVFVHQGDVPAEGLLLGDIPDDVFALIRLTARRADDNDFSFITAAGQAKMPAPVFQIRFKGRSTLWYYYHANTGKNALPSHVELFPLPLTFFGNASPAIKRKPSQGLVIPEIDDSIPPKVQELRSEIFEPTFRTPLASY